MQGDDFLMSLLQFSFTPAFTKSLTPVQIQSTSAARIYLSETLGPLILMLLATNLLFDDFWPRRQSDLFTANCLHIICFIWNTTKSTPSFLCLQTLLSENPPLVCLKSWLAREVPYVLPVDFYHNKKLYIKWETSASNLILFLSENILNYS